MLAVLLSLVIAVSAFVVLEVASEGVLDHYLNESDFTRDKEREARERFAQFVTTADISTTDHERLSDWVREERYLDLYVFAQDQIIYSSNAQTELFVNKHTFMRYLPSDVPITAMRFADRDAQVYMVGFYEYQYYNYILMMSTVLAAIIFIVSFLLIINKKTSYIGQLEQEIKILEGGNLEYPITVTGNDELSSLAQSIDEMRKSFMERLNSEEKVMLANRELITSISHDLRTPLTILLGYLDIVQLHKYKTQEELLQYIRNGREKAYQIKALSDKLFEYFTVSSSAFEAEQIDVATYEGGVLIDQLLDEQRCVPGRESFRFEVTNPGQRFWLAVNLVGIRRVFDNIFSNIQKYADPSQPIVIACIVKGASMQMTVRNKIRRVGKKRDSNGIGLISCRKIIQQHQGTLMVSRHGGFFTLELTLPLTDQSAAVY